MTSTNHTAASNRHPTRDVNGTDNFRTEFASTSVFKDMVCTFRNPQATDADKDFN